jgi:peptidoglycan-N-acetylglucosamine deacetylase
VARIAAEGHAIGNHGWYHRKLHLKSPAYVREDLGRGTTSIEKASGVHPRLFRAPHGFRSPWVTWIARSLGQRTVGWSLGVWDTDLPGADVIADRTVEGARPGSILLLHDGDGYDINGDRSQTAEAVPMIVDRLHERGYRFALLDAA